MRAWNNMQYAASAAFLLAVYSDYLSNAHAVLKCPVAQVQPQDLLNFAQSQALILYTLSFFSLEHFALILDIIER